MARSKRRSTLPLLVRLDHEDAAEGRDLVRGDDAVGLGHLGGERDHGDGEGDLAPRRRVGHPAKETAGPIEQRAEGSGAAIDGVADTFPDSHAADCRRSGAGRRWPDERVAARQPEAGGRAAGRLNSTAAPPSVIMPRSHPALGLVLGLAAVVIFGGSLPATRLAVAALDPWFVTAGRAAVGAWWRC